MKASAELWVRLKVIDLVVQTAQITLTEKMGFASELCGMARYSWWALEAEGPGAAAVSAAIDREIRIDSAFTNQNKHRYRLAVRAGGEEVVTGDLILEADLPGAGCAGPVFACDLLVSEQGDARAAGYAARLGPRLAGLRIESLRCGEVWRILVRAQAREAALGLVDEMALTRSRRHGLLVNPHYQRCEVIGVAAVGGEEGGGRT